jgi:hypothetical protein
LTILDSNRKPYSNIDKVKYVLVRCGYAGIGMIITAIPTIFPYIWKYVKASEDASDVLSS